VNGGLQQDPFNYDAAFSRNLGWTTEWEQAALRTKRVAIAGMGGAGGIHLITLARLGVGRFHIADFDRFDIVNMNRQAGATVATIGRPKVTVMSEIVGSINPEAEVVCFPDGATRDNLDAFLNGCDLFVDGLDFFALDIRELVFRRCEELGIPAVTAAPIGMGVGYLAFLPGKMTFERYFRLQGHSEEERSLRFLMGVAPRGLHRTYLADDTRVDLAGKRGPSTAAACALCAGVVSSQAVRLLLGRGVNIHAPVHLHFDAYRGKLARSRLRWGNSGPIQSLKLAVARRIYGAMTRQSRDADAASPEGYPPEASLWLAILDLARWAPSGDNEQPWRFAILDVTAATVRVADLDVANPAVGGHVAGKHSHRGQRT
jgi:molybdopterin/thiamine biosynthesis adenylyltransferase